MLAYEYPAHSRGRTHGPHGYKSYEQYRPWLRDEFVFRCAYCLVREQWGRETQDFDIDHFVPRKSDPARKADYDNLVYACGRCNKIKSTKSIPDPLGITAQHLRILPDGRLEPCSPEAEALVETLLLNSPKRVEFRVTWIRIIELAREHSAELFERLMGFPVDLPDLGRLRPRGGNSRPEGVANSHLERKKRGELPPTY
jgi:hypothetical protein